MEVPRDREGEFVTEVFEREVCILPNGGRGASQAGKSFVVTNDQEGLAELLRRLKEPGSSPKLVVLEATGRYERLCASSIAASGIPVAVINPRQARDFAKAIGRPARENLQDRRLCPRPFRRGCRAQSQRYS